MRQWTICIGVFVIIIIAGAVGGGIHGKEIWDEREVVTETQSVSPQTAAPSSSAK
jgi:hypothetical protein